jgi:alkylation response protein AidB-like acyl-CoA dehydrogenase
MNFDLTDEQQMLKDGVQRYMREKYGFEARRLTARGQIGWSSAHWSAFAELGWLALGIPESAGGLGGDITDTLILSEAFGHALVLEPYTSTIILGARILEQCDRAPRDAMLGAIMVGEAKLALAHEEPGIRHQRHAAKTIARRSEAGYIIDGRKTAVFDAPMADHFIVSVTLEDGDFALFLADAKVFGLRQRGYKLLDGTRAADLEFESVVLGEAALLMRGATARACLEDALDRATLAQVAESLGVMREVLRITSDYLKTRSQFGQPIGKFQALQHRMAEMFTQAQSARSMLFHGLANMDAASPQRAAAVSAAKVATAEAGFFVGSQGIQLHGGMGMTDEYPVGHYFKRLVVLEKAYGDSDWHLARYASLRIGQG